MKTILASFLCDVSLIIATVIYGFVDRTGTKKSEVGRILRSNLPTPLALGER